MINRTSIFTPVTGSLVELRLPDKGSATHTWTLQVQQGIWVPGDRRKWQLKLTGQIVAAGLAEGIDARLVNQRASIDRLLKHVQAHCPKLSHGGDCAFGEAE